MLGKYCQDNITTKFRLHTRFKRLIKLKYLFSLYFYTLCVIQNGDIERNHGPKSSFPSAMSI